MREYPMTLEEFEKKFNTEESCRDYLFALRWSNGFECPKCGNNKAWPIGNVLFECSKCNYQTSVIAGTIFQDTHKPLTLWFRAIWWVTAQKNGASALGLQKILGLGSYRTAWTWLHKLRRAMVRPGRDRLHGRVEVDETFVGGEEEGISGRRRGRGPRLGPCPVTFHPGRFRRQPAPFRRGLDRAGQHGSHRWLAGLQGTGAEGIHVRGHRHRKATQRRHQVIAACTSGGLAAQTLAAGHAPRRGQPGAPGLLPG